MADASKDPHHFDFDLDRGIREQVVEKLEASPFLPLTKGVGPQASGIYALYFKGRLVYIGKASKGTTKSKRTLRTRLDEHVGKINGRRNISLKDIHARYLTLASEWWVFAAEFAPITHYRTKAGLAARRPAGGHHQSFLEGLTTMYSAHRLVYCESSPPPRDAIQAGKRLKKLNRAPKIRFIERINPG